MFRLLSAALVLALLGGINLADDKKPDENKAEVKKDEVKLAGIWNKEVEGLNLQFDFTTKDVLTLKAGAGENGLIITTKTSVDKDGRITAKSTKVEIKGEFPVKPSDKYEFSFKLKVDGKKATISDFKANENEEEAKHAVEGEYTLKEDK
jgi:hypothetical protein